MRAARDEGDIRARPRQRRPKPTPNAAGADNNIARGLALVYTLVAVFTGAWGYGIYMWRQSLIYKRSGRDFDAITGPVVVCIGLIVALLLNFAFKVCRSPPSHS